MNGPNVNVKLPVSFTATFQIIKTDQKFFIWTNNTTCLTINKKHCITGGDYAQLRNDDEIDLPNWTCKFVFEPQLQMPITEEQATEMNFKEIVTVSFEDNDDDSSEEIIIESSE